MNPIDRQDPDRPSRSAFPCPLTGFDNIKLSEFSYPPLTTLHIPRDRIGHLAFSMLVPESARGKLPGREIVLDPELVLRDSTGPAPRTELAS